MTEWDENHKHHLLDDLANEWSACESCVLHQERKNFVFGNGNPDADIMFIGEGPGEVEDQEGVPFVGQSGALLNDLLQAAGIERKNVFITNLVKCRIPLGRDATMDEKKACSPLLQKQIYVVDPLLIVCVGKQAMSALMGGGFKSIVSDHGKLGEVEVQGQVRSVTYPAIPILHPAFILREDSFDRKTRTWKRNGYGHQTLIDLIRVKDVVAFLRLQYETAQKDYEATQKPSRRLKVVQ